MNFSAEQIAEFTRCLNNLQAEAAYKDVVLGLRSEHKLHDFFEWRMSGLVAEALGTDQVHLQKEKYGVSNGRIDLAAYLSGRSVIHIELIASASNGHVFRDTTSLLFSCADQKMAVLIDADLDTEVSAAYLKGIPDGRIDRFWLRLFLLNSNSGNAIAEIRQAHAFACAKSGATSASGFQIVPTVFNIKPMGRLEVCLHNVPVPSMVKIDLRGDSYFREIGQFEVLDASKKLELTIPADSRMENGTCRLEATLDSGRISAAHLKLSEAHLRPVAICRSEACEIDKAVELELRGFLPESYCTVFLWQDFSGSGIGRVKCDCRGDGSVKVQIPRFLNGRKIRLGFHRISVVTDGLEANVHVKVVDTATWAPCSLSSINSASNGILSLSVSAVQIAPGAVKGQLSICALVDDCSFSNVSVMLSYSALNVTKTILLASEYVHKKSNLSKGTPHDFTFEAAVAEVDLSETEKIEAGRLVFVTSCTIADQHHAGIESSITLSEDQIHYLLTRTCS